MSTKYVGFLIALLTISPYTVGTQAGVQVRANWIPAKVTQSMFIGTVSTVPITLISQTPLFGVRVLVGPELAPYVSPVPSEFASVAANTPIAVTLAITVPTTTTPGTILGSIDLVDSTHTWQTFARLPVELHLRQPAGIITIEPDWFAPGTDVSHASPGVTLRTITAQKSVETPLLYSPVYVRHNPVCDSNPQACDAVTGSQGFSSNADGEGHLNVWGAELDHCFIDAHTGGYGGNFCARNAFGTGLLLEFDSAADFVEIAGAWQSDYTVLRAIDEAYNYVPVTETQTYLPDIGEYRMSIVSVTGANMKYVVAESVSGATALDTIRYRTVPSVAVASK